MRGLIEELNALDSSLPPRLYLASLLQRVSGCLDLDGGMVLTGVRRPTLEVVAADTGDELKHTILSFLPTFLENAGCQPAILSPPELPGDFVAQGISKLYWLPINREERLSGACLWVAADKDLPVTIQELECTVPLVALSLAGYLRIRNLAVKSASHRNVISGEKRALELNLQLAEDVRLLLDSTSDGLYGVDLEGKCTFVNKAAARMFGYATHELLGYDMHELIHHTKPDGSKFPAKECNIHTFKTGTGSGELEELFWRKDGSCFPVFCSSSPISQEGQSHGAVVNFIDATNYKAVEKELMDAKVFAQAMVNELPEYIGIIDSEGIIQTVNTPWRKQVDLYPEVFSKAGEGENYIEFCKKPPEQLAQAMPNFAEAIDDIIKGRLNEYYQEYCCRFPDQVMWFAGRINRMEGTGPLQLLVTHFDITGLKGAEQRNKSLAASRQLILDSSGEGIVQADPQGRILFANQAACRLLGYGADELLGQGVNKVTGAQRAGKQSSGPVDKALETGELITENKVFFSQKDGTLVPVRYSAAPMYDEGKLLGAVVVFSDLSKIIGAEKARREADIFARAVVNNISSRIAITDRKGVIVGTNSAWRKFARAYGVYIKGTARGKDYREVCVSGKFKFENFAEKFIKGFSAVMEGKRKDFKLEYSSTVNGETRWFQGTVRNLSAERLLIVHEDVTERKLMFAALETAKEAAEEANRAKSEFLANMSHEIRTPLNAIIGMAELLDETAMDSRQKQYVSIFRSAGDHLLSLIDNVLDLSRIESGRMELELVEYDIGELVEDTSQVFAVSAHRKNLEITCQVGAEVPHTVVGDPGRVRQVLVNLVGNAIKFTSQGEINVCVKVQGKKSPRLVVSVADTGPGIPQDKIKKVFSAFTQSDSSTTRQFGGSGLGLKISQRLVEMMGGEILVRSQLDKGSTFSFTIPFQPGSQRKAPGRELEDIKVLVIDDNPTNRLILFEYLAPAGGVVECADSGQAGLELFQQARCSGEIFDLVLLDCRMPEMDGFAVTKRLREQYGGEDVVVMMLTSDNSGSAIRRCQELGINGYLVKPIRKKELIETIRTVMGGATFYREISSPTTFSPLPRKQAQILLVEDSPDNILLVENYLSNSGYSVSTAENGEIAVAKYKARNYDLVLMDIEMPIMDGHTATRLIREWEKQNRRRPVPIIALTAYAFAEDRLKSIKAGCTDHLTKPIRKQKLLAVLAENLEGKKDE